MLGRGAFRGVLCGRVQTTRTMATNARANPVLRPIHFEIDTDVRLLGEGGPAVSDCWGPGRRSARLGVSHAYRGRAKTKSRVVRNRFGYPNFLSLWVDKLDQVEAYLQQENVPYTSDGIVKGPEVHDVMVI
ncbi:hypothetical protein PsorP6_017508 [Peronosclerospora sorghi]|uniref:Uncharacterized protein n=1 Tax=Peronosclerospora sorghi TaxID=230839 RepID=A0ACC0WM06_9STRA|nr:hypothetical protein PsorP6_017508 [Peronosclerospora sorghi]